MTPIQLFLLLATAFVLWDKPQHVEAYIPNPPPPPETYVVMRSSWWQQDGSQQELVNQLRREGVIQSDPVRQVMLQVDRKNYVDEFPYMDTPQTIPMFQTISAPHMHAHALQEILPHILDDKPVKILDVGCGSGYLTACLGRWFYNKNDAKPAILQQPGQVFGMDIYKELVDLTRENILKEDADLIQSNTIQLRVGNGWQGWPDQAPFDAIHVGAAAPTLPEKLAQQLTLHGVLIIPLGPNGGAQELVKVERIAGDYTQPFDAQDFRLTRLLGVRYVPLVEGPS